MPTVSDDRITLQNPNTGRDDARIEKRLYDPVRSAILRALDDRPGLPFADLREAVEARTDAALWSDASVGWYTTAVKLDLEARGLLRREGSPQRLTLTDAGRAALTESS